MFPKLPALVRWVLLASLGILFGVGYSAAARATELSDLFLARIAVESQSAADRQVAVGNGLVAVAARVSGLSPSVARRRLGKSVAGAESYLVSYSYRESSTSGDGLVMPELELRYDEAAVTDLIGALGLPIWGRQRPMVLCWILIGDSEPQIVAEQDALYSEPIYRRARERGIPLLLPLFDLEDRMLVSIDNIRSQDLAAIRQAAPRYGVDTISLAQIRQTATGSWSLRWRVRNSVLDRGGDTETATIKAAMTAFADAVADELFQAYATHSGVAPSQQMEIQIQGIGSQRQYEAAMNYLRTTSGVNGLKPRMVTADAVTFVLSFPGTAEELRKQLSIGGNMQPSSLTGVPSISSPSEPMMFIWLGGN